MTALPPAGDEHTMYVVDLSGYVFRAFHAIPSLTTSRGEPTNAIYGVVAMLLKLVKQQQPRLLAVALDGRGPTMRHGLYAAYKATRPPAPPELVAQIARLKDVIDAYAIPLYAQQGVEADDLIATVVRRARAEGLRVVVVSADKDLLQLVDGEDVLVWDTMRDKVFGEPETVEKMGVPPRQVRDLLALMGDTSDNIPGVPSVGPKTAAQLLHEHGDLDALYAHLDRVAKKGLREKLETHRADAMLSRDLVRLVDDLAIDFDPAKLHYGGADVAKLRALFTELEFTRLVAQLPGGEGAPSAGAVDGAASTEPAADQNSKGNKADPPHGAHAQQHADVAVRVIREAGELPALVAALEAAESVAIFPALDADDTARATSLVGVALAYAPGEAVYLPFDHRYLGAPAQLERAATVALLRPLLERASFAKLSADAKRDSLAWHAQGVAVAGITFDTMLASYLVDPEQHGHSLPEVAQAELGVALTPWDVLTEKQRGSQRTLPEVALEKVADWAGRSAAAIRAATETLGAKLRTHGLMSLLTELELPLACWLAVIEREGVLLDLAKLAELSKQAGEELAQLEARCRELAGGKTWNLASPRQLETVLFDELGLRVVKRTKTGRSTDHDVLEELAAEHPLPALVLEHRALSKLKGTYLDAFPRLVDAGGRIHTRYNQAVAATGRLSSSEPNLQNIPVKTAFGRRIREAFVAPPGALILAADYSQIELRVLAHLSRDAELLDAFRTGDDVHVRTAKALFGVEAAEVTREQRNRAKTVNFAVIYGQTETALARGLKIERAEAGRYIEAFFTRYAGVRRFLDEVVREARETGEVRTLLGRRRLVPDLASSNRTVRFAAERVARNTPIQGTSADILKRAMVTICERMRDARVESRMLLTVHDELIFEVPRDEQQAMTTLVRTAMEGAIALEVPLLVEVGCGPNWGAAH
jgi:DNA polymerase-1